MIELYKKRHLYLYLKAEPFDRYNEGFIRYVINMEIMATLSNNGDITIFAYKDKSMRFCTSRHLVRYTKVLEWDIEGVHIDYD